MFSSVQTVVASIASDPNVWNAMLGNEALKSFLQSYQTSKTLLIVKFGLREKKMDTSLMTYDCTFCRQDC